jgi:hypothetical protein
MIRLLCQEKLSSGFLTKVCNFNLARRVRSLACARSPASNLLKIRLTYLRTVLGVRTSRTWLTLEAAQPQ